MADTPNVAPTLAATRGRPRRKPATPTPGKTRAARPAPAGSPSPAGAVGRFLPKPPRARPGVPAAPSWIGGGKGTRPTPPSLQGAGGIASRAPGAGPRGARSPLGATAPGSLRVMPVAGGRPPSFAGPIPPKGTRPTPKRAR